MVIPQPKLTNLAMGFSGTLREIAILVLTLLSSPNSSCSSSCPRTRIEEQVTISNTIVAALEVHLIRLARCTRSACYAPLRNKTAVTCYSELLHPKRHRKTALCADILSIVAAVKIRMNLGRTGLNGRLARTQFSC